MSKKLFVVVLSCAIAVQMSVPAWAIVPGEDCVTVNNSLMDDPVFLAEADIIETEDGIKLTRVVNTGTVGGCAQYRSDAVHLIIENEADKDELIEMLTVQPLGTISIGPVLDNMATVALHVSVNYEIIDNTVVDEVKVQSVSGYIDIRSSQVQCVSHCFEMGVTCALSGGPDWYGASMSINDYDGWVETYYNDDITVRNMLGSKVLVLYTVTVRRGLTSEWEVTAENFIKMPVE